MRAPSAVLPLAQFVERYYRDYATANDISIAEAKRDCATPEQIADDLWRVAVLGAMRAMQPLSVRVLREFNARYPTEAGVSSGKAWTTRTRTRGARS